MEPLLQQKREIFQVKGFLTRNPDAQKMELKRRYDYMKRPPADLAFQIIPSLRCNLECPYCYEKGAEYKNEIMNHKNAEKTFKFIQQCINRPETKYVSLKFYGGETLLALDICKYLSHEVNTWAKNHAKIYSCWVQTNGTLITSHFIT